MRPLFILGNDDGYQAKGLQVLIEVARAMGDVIVMSTEHNASAKSMSLTTHMPLRARLAVREESDTNKGSLTIYATNGTPADSIKLGLEHFVPRQPDFMFSGINHGSNASINVLYSGTMGAALEATVNGIPSVGFSLLDHDSDADFSLCEPFVRQIIRQVTTEGLPEGISLNVNFPYTSMGDIKGLKTCRAARAQWHNSYAKYADPHGKDFFWMTGDFVCLEEDSDTDEWALAHGYASVVPLRPDYTDHNAINIINRIINN